MTVAVKIKSGNKLKKALEKYARQSASVSIGFFENAKYPAMPKEPAKGNPDIMRPAREEQYVAQVAFWNEYGTKTAPARPFFRTAIAENKDKWRQGFKKQIQKTKDIKKALSLVGEVGKADIQESIVKWTEPPNRPRTILYKGFNKPLEDSKQMLHSVSYEVSDK